MAMYMTLLLIQNHDIYYIKNFYGNKTLKHLQYFYK